MKSLLSLFTVLTLAAATGVTAQTTADQLEEVTFRQRLGSKVPMDLQFRDDSGQMVTLGDLVQDRPILLSLVYYECPMLCTLVLNGQVDAMKQLPFNLGDEYQAITVSFDHEETHVLAANKKKTYVGEYGREGAAENWHFLVGEEAPIKALCDSVGFTFKYMEQNGEYAHKSGIVLLTPDGTVSRYFPGTLYEPTDLRLGLVEASENKVGSLVDRLFLLCYHYDPTVGKYGLMINRVVNTACTVTLFAVLGTLYVFFREERRTSTLSA